MDFSMWIWPCARWGGVHRHPLTTAKQVATLDQLSGGRFTLAACVGWCEHEFELLGVPFRERGAVTGEYLDAMRGAGGSAVLAADPRPTTAFAGTAEQVAASIARYAEAGLTELAIDPADASAAACMERVEWFAEEVLPLVGGTGTGGAG